MCEAEEGLSGFDQNRLVNASRLTLQDIPLGHHWSWECPMQTVGHHKSMGDPRRSLKVFGM